MLPVVRYDRVADYSPPRWRVLWVEGRLDCRTWSYYCDVRSAFSALHEVIRVSHSSVIEADAATGKCRLDAKRFQLIVVGPRYATNVVNALEPLGLSRAQLATVPLVVLQNKMYTSATELTGSVTAKLQWATNLGAAAGFTWLGSRKAAEFTASGGLPYHWMPFGVDASVYGKFAGNFTDQPFDIGFTGSSGPKYALRAEITAALRSDPARLRTYFGSWDKKNVAGGGGNRWFTLSRVNYVKQIARTKIWVSTTGPEGIVGTRFFEVLASGTTLLLCNRVNETSLWEDGVHLVMFDGMEDMLRKVHHYLSHEEERRAIVTAARTLVLERHTWAARAKFLTRATEEAIARHPPEVPWFVDGKLSPQTGPPRDGGKSLLLGCYMPTNTSHRQSSFWAGTIYALDEWRAERREQRPPAQPSRNSGSDGLADS
ncbi:hypothetical protein EMIHUDRAFT_214970 [Emiliania huxleyi CCMP1516]|uniref:Spore protein YkvP/CgeB glycosyl transferase-like domain-containing protein n=2 Tax=Emiliania huxleyi TaxID=2903 RepID=A0A0D3IIQ1_EMIH1|nr:hypothetical protein EMIHUDRAFT_214970 [Emiliania huxleyi CCMP1516]EOD11136.1 hypothetical protein EMIHUDRAFT_214970 [Emiliania huxleyi CCMP1516]|eukprot:XP_005763565.1 hypothetical protein EMIHUDRAFT_214970 [Emiliania huxleyi CCMP1516]